MIDIRELTPNCHVMLGDKRVKVVNIDSLNNLIGVEKYYYVAQDGTKYCIGNEPNNLDPIPITEELLKELGFSEAHDNITTYTNKIGEHFIYLIKINGEDTYDLSIIHNGIRNVAVEVEYLHELEAFVYLTTKQELI